MVFSSVTFLFYFLPVVLGLYFLAPCRIKNCVLLIASLFFYAWGEPVYVFLMVASIILNYVAGRIIFIKHTRGALAAGVVINLLVLGFFKYVDFIIGTINTIFSLNMAQLELPLPIGISFYTFQAMSYLIDLYRGEVKVQRNFIDFATYIALFPQLIAGPIVRIKSIEEQLHFRVHNWDLFASGVRRFVIGLGKKVLIANNMGLIWDSVSQGDLSQTPVLTAWLGILGFTMQIYFDFSGYSDMAIGLGRMFGFEFPENFKHPYVSKSITEFWRRWHISLGTWFKEYVYIPLGGNKKGLARQIFNIMVVWMLTGLWHGASWNFVMWGTYFGLLLMLEKSFLLKALERAPAFVSHFYTMALVMISWVIFSLESVSDIFAYVGAMFGAAGVGFADSTTWYLAGSNALIFIAAIIGSTEIPAFLGRKIEGSLQKIRGVGCIAESVFLAVILLISTGFIVASTYNPFLYFRF